MIDLKDCELIKIMPQVFRQDVLIQAISYALHETANMLIEKVDRASTYAVIDLLPEKIIDLLAEELRAQYYDTALPEKEKREAVKKALPWHYKAGTVSAVKELTNLVWKSDSAQVEEWFEYNAAPYLFRIMLETNISIEEKKIDDFLAALWKVKNTRSHLEAIAFRRKIDQTLYIGTVARSYGSIIITDVWNDRYEMKEQKYYGAAMRHPVKRISIREE